MLGPLGEAQSLVFGYDTTTASVIAHTENALMSYCALQRPGTTNWPDIGSYNKLAQDFAAIEAPAGLPPEENDTQYYYVSGSVDLVAESAQLDPVELLVPPYVPPPPPPPGDWLLVVHSNGAPDASIPLLLKISPNDPGQARFSDFVAHDPYITGFSVQHNSLPLAQVTGSNNAPEITITAPAPGTLFLSEDIELAWNASDEDGDDLVFVVEYSTDGGATWGGISALWPASPFTVFSDLIEPSQNALFRVTALDGFHSTGATLGGAIEVIAPDLIHEDGFE